MRNSTKSKKPVVKLKGLRGEKMVTQGEIANVLGISTATYNRKENGTGHFGADEIYRLTEFFNVKFEDIFVGS